LSRPEPLQAASRGFRSAAAPQRAAFGMLASSALTIGTSRVINYWRERRRPAPGLRSRARRAYHAPGSQDVRVHHFVPGIAISLIAGGTAILTRKDGAELWLSLPFGIGTGLTIDEAALLADLDNAYWGSEGLAFAQAGAMALGATALGAIFYRRGATPDSAAGDGSKRP